MPNRSAVKIDHWGEFLFAKDQSASNFHDDVGLFQLFRTWRRYFLIFVLSVISLVGLTLGLDNLINLHKTPLGFCLLGMGVAIGFSLIKVVRTPQNLFVYEMLSCCLIVLATTAAAYTNGILPMVLFSATVVCYYMLLPVRYAFALSLLGFGLNSAAMLASPTAFEPALYTRVVAEAFVVMPVLHFYVCLTNYLASHYSSALTTRTRFLSTVSHELRSPLNGLSGLLHLTEELSESTHPADRRQVAQNLKRMGQLQSHLADIIGNTLDLNQIRAGKLIMRSERIDWPELIDRATEAFRATCEEKGLLLKGQIDHGFAPRFIMADSLRLRQIMFNLLSNAVKYTQQGRVCVSAKLKAQNDKQGHLRLEVLDTGLGIAQSRQHEVFQEFSQLHDSGEVRASGTGLGLSLVKELVQEFGGLCGFSSTEGVGSQFWVELPVELAEDVQLEGAVVAPAGHSEVKNPEALKGLRVLVVDDEMINRQVICRILERRGVEAIQAVNGQEALDLAASLAEPVDIIMMDIQMPVMDGLAALPKLRALPGWKHVPAICISGAMVGSAEDDPLQHGYDELLPKPIEPAVLLAKAGYYRLLNKIAA